MSQTESSLQQLDHDQPAMEYVFPDDIINALQCETFEERLDYINVILQGTESGKLQLHPDLATVTFLVMCSEPDIAKHVLHHKSISIEQAQQHLLPQKEQILNTITQIREQVPSESLTPYQQQLLVAEPYIKNVSFLT